MERVTIGNLKPDLTIILDVPVTIGMERALKRRGSAVPDRFEGEGVSFHEKLRNAYRKIAEGDPQRCALVDADADAKTVAERVWKALRDHLFTVAIARETTKA